jgi:hypothetical protein
MDQSWQVERQRAAGPVSSRSFLTRALTRRDSGITISSEDLKGPIGLTTLSEPAVAAVADLVFVHGLRGGSRSTWTKSEDPSLFWPEWLPQDPGFKDVRIHTFGYNSNWGKESTLNTLDFAKSLLGSIQNCPVIPRGSTVRLTRYSARDCETVFLTFTIPAHL